MAVEKITLYGTTRTTTVGSHKLMFLMMTWALSLVPIMAMSVRILFTSHDRCWSVGSRPFSESFSKIWFILKLT